MYDVKSFSIYEDNDYFHPYLYSVWHVKRDGEVVFHQKAPGKLTEPETLNCFIHTVSGTGKVFADNREFILNENSLILFETKKIASYFAFGGVVTFKNAKKDDILRAVPSDRLIVETDCPYMTPVPFRGKRNEPKYVVNTAEYIANALGVDYEEFEKQTVKNTLSLFTKMRIK